MTRSFPRMFDGSVPPAGTQPDLVVLLFGPFDDEWNPATDGSRRWSIQGRSGFSDGTATIGELEDVEAWASKTAAAHTELVRLLLAEIEGPGL